MVHIAVRYTSSRLGKWSWNDFSSETYIGIFAFFLIIKIMGLAYKILNFVLTKT